MNNDETCNVCNGKGEIICPACSGSGKEKRSTNDHATKSAWESCALCKGKGKITCRKCNGAGKTKK